MEKIVQKIRTGSIALAVIWVALRVVIEIFSFFGALLSMSSYYDNAFQAFTSATTSFFYGIFGTAMSALVVILLALLLDPAKVADIPILSKKKSAVSPTQKIPQQTPGAND